jgi:hypothetical protein
MHSLSSILSDRPVVRALSWLVFFAVGLPLVLLAIIFIAAGGTEPDGVEKGGCRLGRLGNRRRGSD